MKYILFFVTFLFYGCATTSVNVPPEIAEAIPEGSNIVYVYTDLPTESLFDLVIQNLKADEYEIADENRVMGTIVTQYNDISRSITLQFNAVVQPYSERQKGGSVVVLRGFWGHGGSFRTGLAAAVETNMDSGAGKAAWNENDHARSAFGHVAIFASRLPATRVEYRTN